MFVPPLQFVWFAIGAKTGAAEILRSFGSLYEEFSAWKILRAGAISSTPGLARIFSPSFLSLPSRFTAGDGILSILSAGLLPVPSFAEFVVLRAAIQTAGFLRRSVSNVSSLAALQRTDFCSPRLHAQIHHGLLEPVHFRRGKVPQQVFY